MDSQSVQSSISSRPPVYKKLIYLFAFITLLLLMLTLAIMFFGKKLNQSINIYRAAYNQVPQDQNAHFPIKPDNNRVSYASATYIFEGTLKEVKNSPDGAELITDIKGYGIPRFMPNRNTSVVKKNSGKVAIVSPKDLKSGQKVEIGMIYNLRIKKWYMFSVSILSTSPLSATISGQKR